MLALDAVVRALVRRFVTQNRLLEWESADETELKPRRANVGGCVPQLDAAAAILLGLLVWFVRPQALPAALPLLCFGLAVSVSIWLNGSPSPGEIRLPRRM